MASMSSPSRSTRTARRWAGSASSLDRAVARGKAECAGLPPSCSAGSRSPRPWLTSLAATSSSRPSGAARLLKRNLLAEIGWIVAPDAIVATNTSSLSVTDLSVATDNPKRVVGMHFFNPAPVLKFVEIVRTVVTDDAVVDDAKALGRATGQAARGHRRQGRLYRQRAAFGYLKSCRIDVREQGTPPARTSTRRCGSAVATPYPLCADGPSAPDTAYEILDTMINHQGCDWLHAPRPVIKQLVTAAPPGASPARFLLSYAAPGSSEVVADARIAGSPALVASLRPIAKVGVVGRAPWRPGSSRSSPAPVGVVYVARSQEKADGVRALIEKSSGQGPRTRQDHGRGARRHPGPAGSPDPPRWRDLQGRRHRRRGDRRGPAVKQATFAALDSICQARRHPRHDDLVAAGHPVRDGDLAPAGCHRMQSLQPGRDHAPRRGRPDGVDLRRCHTDTVVDLCAKIGSTRCAAMTGPASSSTRCSYPLPTARSEMLEAHYATADEIDTAMKTGCGLSR